MRAPSGDHDGDSSSLLSRLTRRALRALASMTQMSWPPRRGGRTRAIWLREDPAGAWSSGPADVSRRAVTPSAPTAHTRRAPDRPLAKAISSPRGDHVGCVSGPAEVLSFRRTLPSRYIVQIA